MSQAKIVGAIDLPLTLGELNTHVKRLTKEHGDRLTMREWWGRILIATEGEGSPLDCWCITCEDVRREWLHGTSFRGMTVCPDCRNKRCPKATHHDNACTGSNEPGQEGSIYA